MGVRVLLGMAALSVVGVVLGESSVLGMDVRLGVPFGLAVVTVRVGDLARVLVAVAVATRWSSSMVGFGKPQLLSKHGIMSTRKSAKKASFKGFMVPSLNLIGIQK